MKHQEEALKQQLRIEQRENLMQMLPELAEALSCIMLPRLQQSLATTSSSVSPHFTRVQVLPGISSCVTFKECFQIVIVLSTM